jgi:hypothetical protein
MPRFVTGVQRSAKFWRAPARFKRTGQRRNDQRRRGVPIFGVLGIADA